MIYIRRVGLAVFAAFIVLVSYSLALKLPSQINLDVFSAVLFGSFVCCFFSGLISAAMVRNNNVVMILISQILSIAMVGVVWRL